MTFTSVDAATSGDTTNYAAAYVYTAMSLVNGKGHLEAVIQPTQPDFSRSVYVGVDEPGGALVVGKEYAVDGTTVQANYIERTIGNGAPPREWKGNGGKVIITAINGTTVTFRVVNATLSPATGQSTGAAGTFTMNATATTTEASGGEGGG